MNKIIFKTALKTIVAVIIAAILAFAVASLGFPRSMAGICEGFGNYSLATSYSSLSYKFTGDINDLYNCANYGILANDDGKITYYCAMFYEHDGFEEFCEGNAGVKQRVLSNLAAAQYRQGEKDKALNTAEAAMDGVSDFPAGNAISKLCVEVGKSYDKQTAQKLLKLTEDGGFVPTAEQVNSYNNVKNILNTVINHTGE